MSNFDICAALSRAVARSRTSTSMHQRTDRGGFLLCRHGDPDRCVERVGFLFIGRIEPAKSPAFARRHRVQSTPRGGMSPRLLRTTIRSAYTVPSATPCRPIAWPVDHKRSGRREIRGSKRHAPHIVSRIGPPPRNITTAPHYHSYCTSTDLSHMRSTSTCAWTAIPRATGMRVFTVAQLAPGQNINAARAEFLSIIGWLKPGWTRSGASGPCSRGRCIVNRMRQLCQAVLPGAIPGAGRSCLERYRVPRATRRSITRGQGPCATQDQ